MNVTVTCDKCNKQALIGSIDVKTKEVSFADGNQLTLTYYNCPHCGKEYDVAVDDNGTKNLMKVFKSSVERAEKQAKLKGSVKHSTLKIMESNKKKLERARNALNIGYSNSVYQYQGKEYKLEISVPNV